MRGIRPRFRLHMLSPLSSDVVHRCTIFSLSAALASRAAGLRVILQMLYSYIPAQLFESGLGGSLTGIHPQEVGRRISEWGEWYNTRCWRHFNTAHAIFR